MILTFHAITGALLASGVKNPAEAAIVGLVSHYFLDSLPHIDYKIKEIQAGQIKTAVREFIGVVLDLVFGLCVVWYLVLKNPEHLTLVLIGAFFGLLPDGLYFLNCYIKNPRNPFKFFLQKHQSFHDRMHSMAKMKIVVITSQIIVAAVLTYLIVVYN